MNQRRKSTEGRRGLEDGARATILSILDRVGLGRFVESMWPSPDDRDRDKKIAELERRLGAKKPVSAEDYRRAEREWKRSGNSNRLSAE